ncbi:MAG TPA: sugar-binding protein [Vicinamibacterales bacterium]|jgi:ribose transport system substrate-binding protein
MKRLAIAIAAAAIAVTLACSGGSSSGDAPRKYRFAVIPKALDLPVFDYAKKGAERAAQQLGNVEVIWRGPETGDQLKQKEILESFITQRVDGIAISCLNGDFLTEAINRAMDAGIPVVTWDADAPKSKRIAFYGVDDKAGGRIMGEEAVKLLNGKGTVALMTTYGATNLQRRLDGVLEVLAKHPGIRIVETFDVKEDTVKAAELIATGTNRYPDLGAWISVGGWPVFTRNALVPVPKSTLVISFDTIQPAPQLLKEGKVQILIGQKYFGWGEEPVKMLAAIKAGRMPSATVIDSGVDVVRQDNVDEYIANFKKLEAGQ